MFYRNWPPFATAVSVRISLCTLPIMRRLLRTNGYILSAPNMFLLPKNWPQFAVALCIRVSLSLRQLGMRCRLRWTCSVSVATYLSVEGVVFDVAQAADDTRLQGASVDVHVGGVEPLV